MREFTSRWLNVFAKLAANGIRSGSVDAGRARESPHAPTHPIQPPPLAGLHRCPIGGRSRSRLEVVGHRRLKEGTAPSKP